MNQRIPEIVKILANLIQELENAQENRESLEVLGRIKLYSAQLYLETDMEIIALNRDDLEELVDFEEEEFSTNELSSPEKGRIQSMGKLNNSEFESAKSLENQVSQVNESEMERMSVLEDNYSVWEENDPISEEEEIEVEFYPLQGTDAEEFEIDILTEKEEDQSFFIQNEKVEIASAEENQTGELISTSSKDDDNIQSGLMQTSEYKNSGNESEVETEVVETEVVETANPLLFADVFDKTVVEENSEEVIIGSQDEVMVNADGLKTALGEVGSNSENVLRNSQEVRPIQPQLFNQSADLDAYKSKAQEILGMFSLSRRFEFANLLFAGDIQQFTLFLCEVLAAPNSDAREDVIDDWYERNQWRRKDETASDLKRNLRKML